MHLEKTDKRVTHPITADGEYYIARVGRCLEVRCRQTHAVLQVLEPPKEWGNNWLWSSCGFDGTFCVSLDVIRFVKIDSASQDPTGVSENRAPGRTPPPDDPQSARLDHNPREEPDRSLEASAMCQSDAVTNRQDPPGYRGDLARSSSRIHAGVSLM